MVCSSTVYSTRNYEFTPFHKKSHDLSRFKFVRLEHHAHPIKVTIVGNHFQQGHKVMILIQHRAAQSLEIQIDDLALPGRPKIPYRSGKVH